MSGLRVEVQQTTQILLPRHIILKQIFQAYSIIFKWILQAWPMIVKQILQASPLIVRVQVQLVNSPEAMSDNQHGVGRK